jgi:hypothetical protein
MGSNFLFSFVFKVVEAISFITKLLLKRRKKEKK